VITAVCAVALMLLLGGMESLEVLVIDRWRTFWPGTPLVLGAQRFL